MNRMWGWIAVAGLVAVLSSCYPGDISNVGETDLVATGARPGYGFTEKTYLMPDTVFFVQSEENAPDTFGHAFDSDIVASVEAGLAGYGYTRLPEDADPESADLLVLNAVAVNVDMNVWTWWPGYYPPYWSCCYGGYSWWPVTGIMIWRSGTVVTLMKDPALEVAGEDAGLVWVGAMNGLIERTDASTRTRISEGVAQAFLQSSYLSGGASSFD